MFDNNIYFADIKKAQLRFDSRRAAFDEFVMNAAKLMGYLKGIGIAIALFGNSSTQFDFLGERYRFKKLPDIADEKWWRIQLERREGVDGCGLDKYLVVGMVYVDSLKNLHDQKSDVMAFGNVGSADDVFRLLLRWLSSAAKQ